MRFGSAITDISYRLVISTIISTFQKLKKNLLFYTLVVPRPSTLFTVMLHRSGGSLS